MTQLLKKLEDNQIRVLFTDYYDTLVHRNVHPNSVLRIWSKIMITELGLKASVDDLYFTFKDAVLYLVEKLKTDRNELPYKVLQKEIFTRLNNANIIADIQETSFIDLFEKAHLRAEINVQRLNPEISEVIKKFKEKGGKVYLLSDFYCPQSLFINLLKHHKMFQYFDGVYSSSTVGKSKHTGAVYKEVLSDLNIDPSTSLMIGDNEKSDSINAEKAGLHSFVLSHNKYLRRNKINGFGNDEKQFKKVVKKTYKACHKKTSTPYIEYALFYHFFIEQLYKRCKSNNINSLFFLSREGLFIKRLFDSYLEHHEVNTKNTIRTHYLKVSRQASLQISLKPIEYEEFSYLKRKYKSISINEFLSFFNLKKENKDNIIKIIDFDGAILVDDFFNSEIFFKLKENKAFKDLYEAHRLSNKEVFSEYINSFNEDIKADGINVVDIGWGGTMQEAIYNFFKGDIKVTGYYLGLNTIYNPNTDTKRYGLNFSILPFENYNFHILRANTQLYEQFAGAGHGCCVEYSKSKNGYTIEHHEENEKFLYENYIGDHQDEMVGIHKSLLQDLETICYDQEMVEKVMINLALKVGLRQNIRKIKFLEALTSGYYQNISNKKTGIEYDIPKKLISVKELVKFTMKPEEYFRYMVKLKHKLYKTNKIAGYLFPSFLIHGYYKFNRYMRFNVLKKVSLLKFNYFR